jgi:excisionase family DNA binding protein
MKFPSGIAVLTYWYDYGEAVRDYSVPAVFISDDNEGKAPFLSPENFDYPDWWYTWIDVDKIIRKLTKQDWALILHYFKHIYQTSTGTYYRWEARERFRVMCQQIYSLLDADEYKPRHRAEILRFNQSLTRIRKRIESGEIDVSKIEPHKFYTDQEVADILRYTKGSIQKMLRDGKLEGVKPLGRHGSWRISGQAILDLMGLSSKGGNDDK